MVRLGLRRQLQVLGALLIRELHIRYGRENIGYIWIIVEPMMLAVGVSLIHSRAHAGATDIEPVPLAIIGYTNYIIFRSIFTRAEAAVEVNSSLLYHRVISIFDFMLARTILDAVGTLFAFALLLTAACLLGFAHAPIRPLFLMAGSFSIVWFSFNIALIVAVITHENHVVARMLHPVTYFLLPLGGAFTPLVGVPEPYRSVIGSIPLAQCFELLRYGEFRAATLDYFSGTYLLSWLLGSMLLGLLLIARLRNRL